MDIHKNGMFLTTFTSLILQSTKISLRGVCYLRESCLKPVNSSKYHESKLSSDNQINELERSINLTYAAFRNVKITFRAGTPYYVEEQELPMSLQTWQH